MRVQASGKRELGGAGGFRVSGECWWRRASRRGTQRKRWDYRCHIGVCFNFGGQFHIVWSTSLMSCLKYSSEALYPSASPFSAYLFLLSFFLLWLTWRKVTAVLIKYKTPVTCDIDPASVLAHPAHHWAWLSSASLAGSDRSPRGVRYEEGWRLEEIFIFNQPIW